MVNNRDLALKAHSAVFDKRHTTKPGYCAGFVHEVLKDEYGNRFTLPPNTNAAATAKALRPLAVLSIANPDLSQMAEGDLLVKWSDPHQPDGHIAIYIGQGLVAENSSVHYTSTHRDARGFRTVHNSGPWDELIRLPLRQVK